MKYTRLIISITAALFIGACSKDSNYDHEASRLEAETLAAQQPGTTFEASFDPANAVIPFPNNILFAGSADGTINITVPDETDYSNPQVALNALDGFSTTAPITTSFNQEVDSSSIALGNTVRIFEVSTTEQGAVTAVVEELNQSQIAAAISGEAGRTLALLPLTPLKESTSYMVILTNGIRNTEATPSAAEKSISYHLASGDAELTGALAALEPIRQLTGSFEAAAVSQGIPKASITLSWSFTTQSITTVMNAAISQTQAGAITVEPTGSPSSSFINALNDAANIHIGSLTVPYYQTPPAEDNPVIAVNGFWRAENGGDVTKYNPVPFKTSDQTIPLMLSIPASTAPSGGWPVAIFQHGITRNRGDMLAISDTMALAGIAVIAIDLPMHGITDTDILNAGSAQLRTQDATERTFDLDLANNATSAAGPDNIVDASGTHFYNLSNLLNTRDNLRQAITDLVTLRKSIASIDPALNLNANKLSFVGHSLGGITGTVFLANDDKVGPGILAMPGGGLVRLLAESPSFGPIINAGLADKGAPEGSAAYESFLIAAQTVTDSGDPINFATTAASKHPSILMFEVVGGSAGSLPDQVIPNSILTAPLSGTEPMIRLMSLDPVIATSGNGATAVSGVSRFISGDHSSILLPNADPLVTVEMHRQMATFAATQGKLIQVNDSSVILTGE